MSGPRVTFVAVPVAGFSVDAASRTIEGVALPYGKVGQKNGLRFKFARGALKWTEPGRVKLLRDHDHTRPLGKAIALSDSPAGFRARFKVSNGPAGDEALALAADGVLDGLSVGVDFGQADAVPDRQQDDVVLVKRADLLEVSLTAMPAFDDARVTRVAASRGEAAMPEEHDQDQGGQAAGVTATATPAAAFTVEQLGQLREFFLPAGQASPEPERPRVVDPTRPLPNGQTAADPYTALGFHADGPPPLMPNREQVVELARAVAERRPARIVADREPVETFATVTTTQTGRPRTYLGGQAGMTPLRIADLVGIPSEVVGWGGAAAFPIFGAGAAGQPAEGAAKTEYAAVTAGLSTPTTIAVWTDMTAQAQSIANFETKLRNKLARLVAISENELLRATVAAAAINTQAFTAGDQSVQILRAAAGIEATNGVRPDLMLFNPADTAAIFGTAVSNAAPQEIAELSVRVFGMIGLPMSTQPAGFVLVGAWAAAARLVIGNRLTYLVDPYTQAKNNIVTLIAEESVALAVEEPTGFTSVDIVTP